MFKIVFGKNLNNIIHIQPVLLTCSWVDLENLSNYSQSFVEMMERLHNTDREIFRFTIKSCLYPLFRESLENNR